jgi:hypothetical protein
VIGLVRERCEDLRHRESSLGKGFEGLVVQRPGTRK